VEELGWVSFIGTKFVHEFAPGITRGTNREPENSGFRKELILPTAELKILKTVHWLKRDEKLLQV